MIAKKLNSPLIIQIISARRKVGKTTIGTAIVRQLKLRGFKVAVIKHAGRIDLPGKDSSRYRNAGADEVILVTEREYAIFGNLDQSISPLEFALGKLSMYDVILIEGFKKEQKGYRIIVAQSLPELEPLIGDLNTIIAVISDNETVRKWALLRGINSFSFSQVEEITTTIVETIQRHASGTRRP